MVGIPKFAPEGFRELRRKVRRVGFRRRIRTLDDQRRAALASLGKTAWDARLDLSAFADVRDQVARVDARAGDLGATSRSLEGERAAQQAKRQAEEARFTAALQPAERRQTEAQSALRAARAALAEKEAALHEVEARVGRLAGELAKPATAQAPGGAADAVDTVRSQHEAALAEVPGARAARDRAAADAQTLAAGAQRSAEEVAKIQADRKATLQPIDAELKRLQEESTRATRETATVAREQQVHFANLGTALYQAHVEDPALAGLTQAIAKLDQERAATQGSLDTSLGLTRAMPRGTMAAFWMVFVGLPLLVIGVSYGVSHGRAPKTTVAEQLLNRRALPGAAGGPAADIAAEEAQKNEALQAFLRAPDDKSKRERAMTILVEDLTLLGSTADRWHLETLAKIIKGGDPELREAATEAVGMIGPTAAELPLLLGALNDPVRPVRDAAAHVLDHMGDNETARQLARLAVGPAASESGTPRDRLEPDVAPDAHALGSPIYPGASFLYYASDLEDGRAAFAAPDAEQKVVDFYSSHAGRQALEGEEFSRMYFGATADDPTGQNRHSAETEAWFEQMEKASKPAAEIEREARRRASFEQNLPLLRYGDAQLYGSPRFVALEENSSNSEKRAPRWVAIVDVHPLGKTVFEIHFPPAGR